MSELEALKKERDAIVARMDLTRTRYRAEMLINRRLVAAGYRGEQDLRFAHDVFSDHFPRSRTFKILTRHPYAAAAGALGVLLLGRRNNWRALAATALAVAPGLLAHSQGGAALSSILPALTQWLRMKPHETAARERGA